jgi:hypothetical protein
MSKKYTLRSDDPWDIEKEDDQGEREKEKKPWFKKISSPNLTEPTIMIAFVTAMFYVVISGYYISYFKRLSIPFDMLDLSLTFYLNAGNGILYVLNYLIVLATLIGISKIAIELYKKGTRDNEFLFMTVTYFCVFIYVLFSIFNFIGNVSLAFSLLISTAFFYAFPYTDYKKRNYGNLSITNCILLAILICLFIPSQLGTNNAEKLIGGDAGSLEVKLNLNDKSSDLLNRTLMLVIHSDNKYYL